MVYHCGFSLIVVFKCTLKTFPLQGRHFFGGGGKGRMNLPIPSFQKVLGCALFGPNLFETGWLCDLQYGPVPVKLRTAGIGPRKTQLH